MERLTLKQMSNKSKIGDQRTPKWTRYTSYPLKLIYSIVCWQILNVDGIENPISFGLQVSA